MSLTSRYLFTQINCSINSPKVHFHSRKLPILSPLRTWLNPFNFHATKSHFLKFDEVTPHSRYRPIWVKSLEQDGIVGRESYSANEFNFDAFLSILEFLSLASSAVISVIFAVNTALSGSQKSVLGWFGNRILVWQWVGLLAGAVVGAVIRRRQWRRICRAEFSRPLNLEERIEKLEEDLKSSATITRVLSRQLEKLGIRFRVTRKALKEPIAETAALAQKNSEATRALAVQEGILEKELGEVQKVLLAMQEQQQKQLELILAIGKSGKLWESKGQENHQDTATDASNPPLDRVPQLGPNQVQALAGQKEASSD